MQTKDSASEMRLAPPGRAGNRLRNLAAVCLTAFAIGFVVHFAYITFQLSAPEYQDRSAPNDVSVFWAAAKMALEGSPVDAFDVEKLDQARNLPDWVPARARQMAWSYPPQFHALILPLGLMSFNLAWVLFAMLGVGAFWIGLRQLIPERTVTLIAVASPAVLMCSIQGQNSLLVAALLAGFLACLRDGKYVIAGVLLGLLTIKPQFGPLLPLVLIACGCWRAIGWGIATSVVIMVLTLAWVGPDYWSAFYHGLSESIDRVAQGWLPRELMITWYAFAIGVGFPHDWAYGLQLAVFAGLAILVTWVWRRPGVPFPVRAAVLTFAIPLASPYAYYYDLVLPMIGIALILNARLVRGYAMGFTLALLWAVATMGHVVMKMGVDFAFAVLTAPVLTAALVMTVRTLRAIPVAPRSPAR